ncbi:MAG: hypothetical protein EZS28_035666, partial [Streblomastix strix]
MTEAQHKIEKEGSLSMTIYSQPQVEDIKTQFSCHAALLKLPNSSDDQKLKELQNLVHLAFGFELSQLHEIVTQSIAIETSLCGAVLHVVQQRGTETEQIADWRTLLSPIVSFLFSTDELISELGKQALIDSIDKKPESLQGLYELDLIEHATEELNHFYNSQSSSQQSDQSVLSESVLTSSSQPFSILHPNKELPVGIIANILQVVIRMLQKGNINDIITAKLRSIAENLSHIQLTQQFEAFCKEILRLTEKPTKHRTSEQFDDQSEKSFDIEYQQDKEKENNEEEQQQDIEINIKDIQQQIQTFEERAITAELRQKIAEDNSKLI